MKIYKACKNKLLIIYNNNHIKDIIIKVYNKIVYRIKKQMNNHKNLNIKTIYNKIFKIMMKKYIMFLINRMMQKKIITI